MLSASLLFKVSGAPFSMKKYLYHIVSLLLLSLLSLPLLVLAQGTGTITPTASSPLLNRLQTVGTAAGYSANTTESTVLEIVGTGISVGLSLLGVIFVILILIAGFNWMTAAGDEEKIKRAGQTIRAAIIGLLIVAGAFAIWLFISRIILDTGGTTNPSVS